MSLSAHNLWPVSGAQPTTTFASIRFDSFKQPAARKQQPTQKYKHTLLTAGELQNSGLGAVTATPFV